MDKARDFWVFSYLCNGLNIKDVCLIRFRDLNNVKLVVRRAKTINSSRSKIKMIDVFLHNYALAVIDKWGKKNGDQDDYVFSVLQPGITPEQQRKMIQNFTRIINKYMRKIGDELKIFKPLTTYVARHSFSTILKRSGVPTSFISDALGHSSLKTTESYLDSFEDEQKAVFSKLLTDFG